MNFKRLALLALLSGVASAQDTVKIGAVTSLTGRFATFGKMQRAGFQVALDEVNAAGGINGEPVQLDLQDDASDTNKALSAAEKLVNEGVPVVIGAYASSITKPLSQYLARQKVPLIVATAVDETITKPGNAYTFRVNNQSSVYSRSLLSAVQKLPIKTIAVLTSNDAFGKSVASDIKAILGKGDYQIVAQDTYDTGLNDFRPLLSRFRAQNPDALLIASYESDSVAIARQAKEVGLSPKLIAGFATGFALPSFVQGAGDAAENVVVVMVWNSDVAYPGAQKLYTKLRAALGGEEPSQHAAQSYAAMLAAVDAVKRAGSNDPQKVRDALAKTKLNTAFGPVQFRNYAGY